MKNLNNLITKIAKIGIYDSISEKMNDRLRIEISKKILVILNYQTRAKNHKM